MNKAQKIVISLIAVLIVVTVLVAIKATSEGATLVALESKSTRLEAENQALREKVVNSTSLTKVSEDATGLGFKKPENITYLEGAAPALSAEAR